MPRTWTCPFFLWEQKLAIHCEGGQIRFVDHAERLGYITEYCASVKGWQNCSIAQQISKRYEDEDQT